MKQALKQILGGWKINAQCWYLYSRKDKPPSNNRSIRSLIEHYQSEDGKNDTDKQQNESKYVEHGQENLPDLANRLNGLTLQGTEQEEGHVHKDYNCPPELKSQWYLHWEKKKNEIIKSEVSCFCETELQINGVTKVMEKQINKYNSLPLISNQIISQHIWKFFCC